MQANNWSHGLMDAGTLTPSPPPMTGGGYAPVRRVCSVRRTMSIDTHWPQGRDNPAHFDARARDVATDGDGALHLLGTHTLTGRASLQREILEITAIDTSADLQALVGLRAGGQLRAKLRDLFPTAAERGSRLYLLADDLAGATLVSSWAWLAWDGYSQVLGNTLRGAGISGANGSMRGICIGLRDGSNALDANGFPKMEQQYSATVTNLVHPDDPQGWHDLPAYPGTAMRRARWIDVFRKEDGLVAETGFQDSGARKDGSRQAVHEYRLRAVLDEDRCISDIEATPYVLPHGECPAAILNLNRLVGVKVTDLREIVPQRLAKEDGCTHLNDVARALTCMEELANSLPGQKEGEP